MDYSSDEDANLSDLEFDEYRSRYYDRLQSGKYRLRNMDETLRCPFCPRKKKQQYGQRDLLRHAYGVSRGSRRRSVKQRAKHCGLYNFMETCLSNHLDPRNWPQQPITIVNESNEKEDLFCWPWIGIIATVDNDVISKESSTSTSIGNWLELHSKYKPVNVETFYDDLQKTTLAVVEFERDWTGFKNALEFERAFVSEGHGRKEWNGGQKLSSLDMYGWIVRADDFYSEGSLGEYIRKKGQLKSLRDIILEEKQGQDCVAKVNLVNEIRMKCEHLDTLLFKLNENSTCFNQMLEEMDQMHQNFVEEIIDRQNHEYDSVQGILERIKKLHYEVESKRIDNDCRIRELHIRKARTKRKRHKLEKEKMQTFHRNTSFRLASTEQMKAYEKISRLIEQQKEETKDIKKELHEKIDALTDMKSLDEVFITKEWEANTEIQLAREVLIEGLEEQSPRSETNIGIKRMGEIDGKEFFAACKKRFSADEAETKATDLIYFWQEIVKNPVWYPFKIVHLNGEPEEVLDEEDEKLKSLKAEWGGEVQKSVIVALKELKEYSPCGRYIVRELWNFKQGRKATLKEAISQILNDIKAADTQNSIRGAEFHSKCRSLSNMSHK